MITDIQIKNWKGQKETSLQFRKGVNFITGPNGSGKTSILDAICFALLGNINFLGSYKGLTFRSLIRDQNLDTEIQVSLSFSGDNYKIVRRISSSRKAEMYKNNIQIESRWDSVTSKILELFNSSDDFLGRCVFLTEGDTYEYISKPPGEGLAKHVEGILGINRMESLLQSMNVISKKHSQMSRNTRQELETIALSDLKDRDSIKQISSSLESLKQEQTTILRSIKVLNDEYASKYSNYTALNNKVNSIKITIKEWNHIAEQITEQADLIGFINDASTKYEYEKSTLEQKQEQLSINKGELNANINNQQAIQEILQIHSEQEHPKDRVCPVCKRLLSDQLAEQINDECQQAIEQFQKQLKDIDENIVLCNGEMDLVNQKNRILKEISLRINELRIYNIEPLSIEKLEKKVPELNKEVEIIKTQLDQNQGESERLQPSLIDFEIQKTSIQRRTDPKRKNDLGKSLVNSSKIEFLSDLFIESLNSSLAEQRNMMLAPLSEELSIMWSKFMDTSIKVELGDKFELNILDSRYDTPFKFAQLSGGEKTALLILTHVLLCKYFSDSDFMLLDEPLEHLDSKNRWALINYLIRSCDKGFPGQLIVTTIEEPYVRGYIRSPSVQVTRL